MKKILTILLVLTVAASLFAGGNQGGRQGGTQSASPLRGADVIWASWWDEYDVNTRETDNEEAAIQLEYRKKLLADHAFRYRHVAISGWGEYFTTVTNNILSRDKSVQIYSLTGEWAITLYKQGLLFPLNQSSVRLDNRTPVAGQRTSYNEMIEKMFTFNGNRYVFSADNGGIGEGNYVYWNKRIFREAGLDPDLPYNLQKDGKWTWDEFEKLAKVLTRDINNNGVIDIYGLACDDPRTVLDSFVYANNGNWVTIDAAGKFHNATTRPEFVEAVSFYVKLNEEGVMKRRPENSAWDWDFTAFCDGQLGMYFAPDWRVGQMMHAMTDDYGCVMPPKGPRATQHRLTIGKPIAAIPAIFTKEEVDVILQAFDLWNVPVNTDWKQGQYHRFRDRRAVDETLAMTLQPGVATYCNYSLVPGFNTGALMWDLYQLQGNPAQHVESWGPVIESWLENINY